MYNDYYKSQKFNQACNEWSNVLCNNFITHSNKKFEVTDVGEFQNRIILGIAYPSTMEQIIKFIKIANKFQIPVYTVSGGKNWGMGSSKPVCDGCVIINLSHLNKIIEINEEYEYAVIESGVTVGALYNYLKNTNSELVANVGGGGPQVTIVGNTLDRGSGIYGVKKLEEILAIEAITGNGDVIRTGYWNLIKSSNDTTNITHFYPYGYGPDLRGLFIQSNMGIVTKMVTKLHKKQRNIILHGIVSHDKLDQLVDTFKELREKNVIGGGVTFFISSKKSKNPNVGLVLLNGSYNMMVSAKKEILNINQNLYNIKLEFFDSENLDQEDVPTYIKDTIHRMYYGNSEKHYYLSKLSNKINKTSKSAKNLDLNTDIDSKINHLGFLVVNASCPFKGIIAKQVVQTIQSVSEDFDIAFSDLGGYGLKFHAAMLFDRNNKNDCKKRHKLKNQLFNKLFDIGIYPQRLDIDNMGDFTDKYSKEYKSVLQSIKKSIDPNCILSPGRYI